MKYSPSKLVEYLDGHRDIFNIRGIEKKLGLSDGTIRHAFEEGRGTTQLKWSTDLSELFIALVIDMYRLEVFDRDDFEERLKFWREYSEKKG